MENSKFGGGSSIQLPIAARLELLNSNERIDVTLTAGKVVSGLFSTCIDGKLELTLVGTDEKTMINVDDIEALVVPQSTARAV
ncbi:hypothetical protein JFU47_19505 [Pseudomonas sp. TH39(2020)]|jgi:hypothetical protein|uniref:hypothetical protein n=1 Tax=Pseudomonas sp. TH39(2020) TaxID=2796349 RepID=UPI001912A057|nr:hypothetical protein [Pseudomonas sp. TH39(2020)]MBK5398882.1 hypothetical protein [Pseudomonas sp. TH39(2020)]